MKKPENFKLARVALALRHHPVIVAYAELALAVFFLARGMTAFFAGCGGTQGPCVSHQHVQTPVCIRWFLTRMNTSIWSCVRPPGDCWRV